MAGGSERTATGANVTVSLRRDGVTKRVVVYPGISVDEVRKILNASFPKLPKGKIVSGVRNPRTKQVYPLEKLTKSPSFFSRLVFELDLSREASKEPSRKQTYKKILSLHKQDVAEVMRIFNARAPSGVLDRQTFEACFQEFLNSETAEVKDEENETKLRAVLSRMFEMFDRDHNGKVDSIELVSGLSVLCKGDQDEKIQSAFELYDLNNDGEISLEEMTKYLTSVFSVIAEANSQTNSTEMSPEKRAQITARQCFTEADINRDGKLTFEEFRAWYSENPTSKDIGLPGSLNWTSTSATLPNLEAVRRATGLNRFTPGEVFDAFEEHAKDGEVNRTAFRECFRSLMNGHAGNGEGTANESMLDRLFGMFDRDGNGIVDFEELASGISVLCGGSRDDKIRAAFQLYDYDNDGFISLDEMKTYLTSVFRVLYDTLPQEQRLAVSAETLGSITAEQCFQDADLDNDGKLSLQEFIQWYSQPSELKSGAGASTNPADSAITNGVLNDSQGGSITESSSRSTRVPSWISLEEARRLTGLEHRSPADVLNVFSAQTGSNGTLDKQGFRAAFQQIIAPHGPRSFIDNKRTMEVLENVFLAFDSDGDGEIDFGELVSGLTVLCGGTTKDKIEHAFELYDQDNDGFITMEEMESYLTSVFRVLYETMPGVREQTGSSPEKLAALTTAECFQVADLNHDGLLSPAEFARWYVSDDGVALAGIESSLPSWMSMDEVKRVTGLSSTPVEEVFEELALAANDDGLITKAAFESVFTRIARAATTSDKGRLRFVIPKLFSVFDTDGNGLIDFSEIASGLSVLCSGDSNTKVESAFALYDYNGDGFVSEEEMTRYFSCVFRIMYEVEPTSRDRIGIDAAELAAVTAKQVFQEADLNSDGRLSFEEFARWYAASADARAVDQVEESAPKAMNIARIRELTTMDKYSPEDVFEVFAKEASVDGTLDLHSFQHAMYRVADRGMEYRSQEERDEVALVVRRLFNLFDTNGDGFVDFSEISSGLSVLCGGNRDVKAEAAFALYDYNGDGMISLEEMTRYLSCVYKVMYELDPAAVEDIEVSPEQLADVTARQIFVEADLNHDGRLGFEEFRQWYAQVDGVKAVAWSDPNRKISEPKLNLTSIAQLTGLDKLSPTDVLNQFARVADADSMLDRSAFYRAFRDIVAENRSPASRDGPVLLDETLARLFDLFDQDGNGRVDFSELALGLSVLCGGTRDDKVKAAFSLYDIDGDGYISLDEMTSYLTSVFRVLYQTQHGAMLQLEGVGADELARVTAEECFNEADENNDGLLTFEEFRNWYEQPAADGDGEGPQDNIAVAPSGKGSEPEKPSWVTLAEVRRLTQLDKFTPEDCFEEFAIAANEDGVLTADAFYGVFNRILEGSTDLSDLDYERLDLVLKRLFTIFDSNKDGNVDFSELATGLSVLCAGDKDSKAQAAFTLYDYNCDGYISLDEMERYLCSVFKVMYETQPGVSDSIGTTPEVLAKSTARQVFQDADINEDGRLSFEEFQAWYQNPAGLSNTQHTERIQKTEQKSTLSLQQVKKLTGLSSYTAATAFEEFALVADEEGVLDRDAFFQVFRKLSKEGDSSASTEQDYAQLSKVLNDLFELFDSDKNGVVDFSELASGMSVLCGGDMNSKAEACFALYDFNADGYIGLDEMVRYLTSIFKVVYVIDPSAKARAGQLSPEELAIITSEEVFKGADVNLDGLLSFEEFQAWYSSSGAAGAGTVTKSETRATPSENSKRKGLSHHASSDLSLDYIRRITGLINYAPEDCFAEFAVAAGADGQIDRSAFFNVFERIVQRTEMSSEDRGNAMAVGDRLFRVFDKNNNSRVDFSELASGLSVLCGGSRDDKAEAAFSLYDSNGDGFISMEEMTRYLLAVFKVMYETQPEAVSRMGGITQEGLAEATAKQVFEEADMDNDGRLSFSEFKNWYSKPSGIAVNTVVEDAPSWVSLVEVRRLTGLDRYNARECAELLRKETNDGVMNRSQFFRAFHSIADPEDKMTRADLDKLHLVLSRLFKILDTDVNGVVDFEELACGLSVLCGGDQHDKAKLAFALFDQNHDGFISLQEMTRYLLSVLRVLKETVPNAMQAVAVDLESLARTTAERCFVDADLNQDGRLSFAEFEKWFCRPDKMSFLHEGRKAPGHSTEKQQKGTAGAHSEPVRDSVASNHSTTSQGSRVVYGESFSLDEIRRLTKLEQYDVEDVLSFVYRSAGEESQGDGLLDHRSFMDVFRMLVENAGGHSNPEDVEKTYKVIHRLFLIFDEDRNGVVDAKELASGLSVLCAGSREDKVESSFKLYDVNGDGYIELDEMSSYLSSVFKVLYEAQPDMANQMGVSPEELGAITAEQCFMEADLDSDGRLSFEEFKEWYSNQS